MQGTVWAYIATAEASVIFAFAVIALFVFYGRHRDSHGKIRGNQLTAVLMLSAMAYTAAILCVCQLFTPYSLSQTVSEGFRDDRVVWLMLFFFGNSVWQLWSSFDNKD